MSKVEKLEVSPYTPQIIHWEPVTDLSFLGISEVEYTFALGLTRPEPPSLQNCYFTVRPTYRITTNGKSSFSTVGECVYQITFNGNKLNENLLYDIIKHTHEWFRTEFDNRKKDSVLLVRELPTFSMQDVQPEIALTLRGSGY